MDEHKTTETVEFYTDSAGEWRWKWKAFNNEKIAGPQEGYKSIHDALHAVGLLLDVPDLDTFTGSLEPIVREHSVVEFVFKEGSKP